MDLKQLNCLLKSIDTDLRAVESLPYFTADSCIPFNDGVLMIPYRRIRIERKLPDAVRVIIDPPNPLQDPSDRRAALERYILCFPCWPNQMDDRIFYTLWATDTHRTRPGEMADAIVNRIKNARAKAKNEFGDLVTASAKEMYRYANAIRTLPQGYHPKPGEACFGGMSVCD